MKVYRLAEFVDRSLQIVDWPRAVT